MSFANGFWVSILSSIGVQGEIRERVWRVGGLWGVSEEFWFVCFVFGLFYELWRYKLSFCAWNWFLGSWLKFENGFWCRKVCVGCDKGVFRGGGECQVQVPSVSPRWWPTAELVEYVFCNAEVGRSNPFNSVAPLQGDNARLRSQDLGLWTFGSRSKYWQHWESLTTLLSAC